MLELHSMPQLLGIASGIVWVFGMVLISLPGPRSPSDEEEDGEEDKVPQRMRNASDHLFVPRVNNMCCCAKCGEFAVDHPCKPHTAPPAPPTANS